MIIKNQIWCLIPARSGSKSIKHKNIYKIRGKELLKYSVEFAYSSKLFDKIIFSSDSLKYFKLIKKITSIDFHHRSKKVSGDKSTDLDVFKEFLNYAKKIQLLSKVYCSFKTNNSIKKKIYSFKSYKKNKKI